MAYLESEVSKHGGKPTELYKFEGTYANFFYTSGPKKVRYPDTPDGDTYFPIALRRSEINCGTQDDDGLDITIEMSVAQDIVQVYAFQNSPPVLDLTILRFHTLDSVVQYWSGPVNDFQIANGVATIRSPSTLGASLAANVPNVYFQSPCNHVLGDARCKVDLSEWTVAATVLAVAGRVITVNSVGTLDGALLGGELQVASGERRMIVAQNAGEVIVNFPFSEIANADIVSATAGCDLGYQSDCKVKYNNNRNFGGFPFIPAANPFQDGIDPDVVPLPDATCGCFGNYQATAWRYLSIPLSDMQDRSALNYDDSSWAFGVVPFSNGGFGAQTYLPKDTGAWFRCNLDVSVSGMDIMADDTVEVWYNGVFIGRHDEANERVHFEFPNPTNGGLVAVRVRDTLSRQILFVDYIQHSPASVE